jgi:hypothetical protein
MPVWATASDNCRTTRPSPQAAGDTKYLYGPDGNLLNRHSPDATTLYTGDEGSILKKDATSADGVRCISIAGETVAIHSSDGHFTCLVPDCQGTGTTWPSVMAGTVAVPAPQRPDGEPPGCVSGRTVCHI